MPLVVRYLQAVSYTHLDVYKRQVFYHRPHDLSDINGQNPRHPAPERQTEFRVEQVVVLADEEYRQFKETGFLQDQIFLFDYQDKMWFDPGSLCWHCVLAVSYTHLNHRCQTDERH